jgi:hypothetical protein
LPLLVEGRRGNGDGAGKFREVQKAKTAYNVT